MVFILPIVHSGLLSRGGKLSGSVTPNKAKNKNSNVSTGVRVGDSFT